MRFFDLHCDTLGRCCETGESMVHNEFHLDIQRGSFLSRWAQCFAVFVPDEIRGQKAVEFFDRHYEYYLREISGIASPLKCDTILTVEGGAACGGTIEGVRHLAQCGVKMMTLTWNGRCEIGDGVMVNNPKGLTPFGGEAIAEMEQLGMIVDVSHASEPLFWDVEKVAKKPYAASHSNSRSIHDHPRNLTDEQFIAIRNRGGIVGINFCTTFLNGREDASLSDVFRHIEHFLSLGGEKTVCIGSDFDGTDVPSELDGIEKIYRLAEVMQVAGYSESLIDDIMFNNAFLFFNRERIQ